jgi:hypothetical protein
MSDIRSDPDIMAALEAAISLGGKARVLQILSSIAKVKPVESNTLTIVVNEGVHHLADEHRRGEVFAASRGSFDLSSAESVHEEFRRVLIDTARKLKSQAWKRVYIVPFGPAPLSMQIKLLVYRICGLESIEVMHIPGDSRLDVSIDLRKLIVESDITR